MRNALLALGVSVLLAGPAKAQSAWADKLFTTMGSTSHDFGTVPRGAQLKYRFHMKNIYKVPLELTNLRVSCGCVTLFPSTRTLQPNQTGHVDINMDARRFSGSKTVSIFITVGPEYISTATLRVTANARQDVVFNPGTVDFGIVQRGQTPTQTLDVEYSGVLDWHITEVVKSSSAPFQVKVEELYRDTKFRRVGRVGYRFNVTLKPDAQPGTFKQELLLKTNDPASPNLTVAVEGTVQASLMVAPGQVQFGAVKVGQAQTRKVLVRGGRPFQITAVEGLDDGITVELPTRAAASHILVIRYQPTRPGNLRRQLTIRTDLERETGTVAVEATAVP
jgi:hypothetical protein